MLYFPQKWSTSRNLIGKANNAHQKPEPGCDAAKDTEHLLSAKQVHSRPRIAIVVVELRAECLLFGRRGTLHSTECTNSSRARVYIGGWIVFLFRAVMWGVRWTTESCVDVVVQ